MLKKTSLLSLAMLSGCVLPSYEEHRTKIDDFSQLSYIEYSDNGLSENVTQIPLIHLYGNSYERGYQYGEAFSKDLEKLYSSLDSAISDLAYEEFPLLTIIGGQYYLPQLYLRSIYKDCEEYIPDFFKAKIQGIADGANVDLNQILKTIAASMALHSSCSGFVAWGKTTRDGRLIHTRNLDLSVEGILFSQYPLVEVHHPEQGHEYLAISILGVPGVITGINEKGISLTEIGAGSNDKHYKGTPMPAMLEQVLLESDNLAEAAQIIKDTPGTGGYVFLIGSAREGRGIRIDKTRSLNVIYTDESQAELIRGEIVGTKSIDVNYARLIQDAVVGSDTALSEKVRLVQHASHGDESFNPSGRAYRVRYLRQCEILEENYGKVDVELAKLVNREVTPKSNLHSVIYDFSRGKIYFANAGWPESMNARAAQQKYIELDLTELFNSQH